MENNRAYLVAYFHGEAHYRCPFCNKCSEYYDIQRAKIKRRGQEITICPLCKKEIKLG